MSEKQIPTAQPTSEESPKHKNPAWAWIALAVTIIAWFILIYSNGYIALTLGAVGLVLGFIGATGSSTGIRRLAITAIIAAMVLVVVLISYLIVLKIALGSIS